jgi:hypothetical protein
MAVGQPTHEGAFEGDLIRPLGLVTLYFGYAEFTVNRLLAWVKEAGLIADTPTNMPLGQKIALLRDTLGDLQREEVREFVELLKAGHPILTRRNALVHASVLAHGHVISNDGSGQRFTVTPQQLCELAEQIFDWKERLDFMFQKQLLPALPKWAKGGTIARRSPPDTSVC